MPKMSETDTYHAPQGSADATDAVIVLIKSGLAMLAAITVFAWLVLFFRRRRVREYDPKAALSELLLKAKEQKEEGLLDPIEYQSIRGQIVSESKILFPERNPDVK
ncbi:MAG: hypothetical protein PHE53_10565 [Thermoguttaceae bacterium]|nr:hypothetical protein [Thermoguttaceae bacterium]